MNEPDEPARPTGRRYKSVRDMIIGEGLPEEVLKGFDEMQRREDMQQEDAENLRDLKRREAFDALSDEVDRSGLYWPK